MYLYDSKMQYLNTIDSQNKTGAYLGGPFITSIPQLRFEKGLIDYKLPVIPPKNNLNDSILLYFGVAILIIIII